MHFVKELLDSVEKLTADFESASSAELVVALARRSDKYADVPYKTGAIAALATLLLVVYLPIQFSTDWFWLDTVLGFVFGWLIGRAFPSLARVLTSRGRRTARVREAAEAVFVNRGVSLTRERTGVLIYISWLEQAVELLWDVGIEQRVPRTVLHALKKEFARSPIFKTFPNSLAQALQPLRKVLDEKLPRPPDDTNEIPNRPVVIG